ncbi:MAG: response regulator, partial [Pirellulaceae bacterium]|nr:response regulator [Pirellulaceae bacterium]
MEQEAIARRENVVMEQKPIRVLLVEDDTVDQMAFARFVRRDGLPYDYQTAGSVAKAKSMLAAESFDIVVADYMLGDGTVMDLIADFRGIPFVVVTGTGDEQTAVQAMRKGAGDYVIKDAAGSYLVMLPPTIDQVLDRQRAKDELRNYQQYLEQIVQERTAELEAEIDQRKRGQVEREKLIAELETRNAELERFVYTVSHDLKTPLLSISWLIGAIKEDMASGRSEDAAQNADRVGKAVETMTQLLEDVLNLARTGRVIGDREDVALAELAREAAALLENRVAEQKARIDIVDAD